MPQRLQTSSMAGDARKALRPTRCAFQHQPAHIQPPTGSEQSAKVN